MTEGFEFIKESGGIKEYRLIENDLTVLSMVDHSAPVVTFMVTYRVGSRNEAIGHTGATHLLEHLMFKGSTNYSKDNSKTIWRVLQDVGAVLNATTWFDRTNYFELLPSEHLEKAISIEADRMRHAFLRDEDRQPEMTVVRNEFERGENEPFEVLDKNIWATAYQAHPYHHATIGWRSDIENVSTERLRQFYDTFYWPNNATVSIVGGVEGKTALGLVIKHFGSIGRSTQQIPVMYTTEPEQEGQRRVVLKRAGEVPIVGIANKSPEGRHGDSYVLQVLASILTSGKNSRFYKSIMDRGLATDVSVWAHPLHDNGLFITYAFVTPGTEPERVEKLIWDEYESLKEKGVKKQEVDKAKTRIRAETAFSRDGSYSIASHLNEAIALGDWTFYTTYLERIEQVTVEDVQRACKTYLIEDTSTVGHFVPTQAGETEG
tara:strand:- start:8093 stop:9391 length:1299 start_codon:yes stop_codon:yes gene_type:complete